jgi:hypothetical protein
MIDSHSTTMAEAQKRTEMEHYDEYQPTTRRYARETILSGTALRDILLKEFTQPGKAVPFRKDPSHPQRQGMFANDMFIMSWCRRQLRPGGTLLEVEGDPDIRLNTSQRKAIAMMLSERVSLIQGVSQIPPESHNVSELI